MPNPTPRHLPRVLDVAPRIVPPYDPGFRPLILSYRSYEAGVRASGNSKINLGIERENGFVATFGFRAEPGNHPDEATIYLIERFVKFLLWSRGGWKIYFDGPPEIGQRLRTAYEIKGSRAFDCELMGRVYEKPFEVEVTIPGEFPAARERQQSLGGHLEGSRIGFDLGASDYKIAAVKDGELVWSDEIAWTPGEQSDPDYHFARIQDGLEKAAARMS